MADIDDQGPSGFTLKEQIDALSGEIERRDEVLKLCAAGELPDFKRETDLLRAALRTLQAMIDDGK